MVTWLTFVLLACTALVVSRMPRPLLRSYQRTFGARHGLSVQVSLTVLGTVTATMWLMTVLQPGAHEIAEAVVAVVAVLAVIAGSCDVYLYSKGRQKKKPGR